MYNLITNEAVMNIQRDHEKTPTDSKAAYGTRLQHR